MRVRPAPVVIEPLEGSHHVRARATSGVARRGGSTRGGRVRAGATSRIWRGGSVTQTNHGTGSPPTLMRVRPAPVVIEPLEGSHHVRAGATSGVARRGGSARGGRVRAGATSRIWRGGSVTQTNHGTGSPPTLMRVRPAPVVIEPLEGSHHVRARATSGVARRGGSARGGRVRAGATSRIWRGGSVTQTNHGTGSPPTLMRVRPAPVVIDPLEGSHHVRAGATSGVARRGGSARAGRVRAGATSRIWRGGSVTQTNHGTGSPPTLMRVRPAPVVIAAP